MTDEFNTQAEDEPIVSPAIDAEELTDGVAADDSGGEEDFFSETEEEDGFILPDPAAVITLQTSSGGKFYIPAPAEGMTVAAVMTAAGLTVGVVEYYLNGSQVKADTVVPGGQTLSVVGVVKGG